jgi:hypothetical protein
MEVRSMTLLAIDPGKRIGWCFFGSDGIEIDRGVTDWDGLFDNLQTWDDELILVRGPVTFKIDHLVVEDYIGRPGAKNGGQHFDASEVIGALRIIAESADVKLVRQRAVDVLKVAALHAGYTLPKGHLPDQDSAYLHGYYRLEQLGILRAKPLD